MPRNAVIGKPVAVSVTSGPESSALVLEFVDLGGEMRRDVWFTFISEVISVHKIINEYGRDHRRGSVCLQRVWR
ncbi:hypothetical protein CASFOL_004593 [Castilleja foliolosa]|uniref:Uncharacterized protein n=1 Tax=Castilleja foliolosa TaxID=1961234 RepID=A0ABD3EB10_9LAMI